MSSIPKKVSQRLSENLKKYKRVLTNAQKKDVNESDTVTIITDMLEDIFGYDKYAEITREQAIRGTFCDLAIEFDGKTQFLIEAKAIGLKLNDSHIRQAVNYGANKGIHWVVLTNGNSWKIYKLHVQTVVDYKLICEFEISDLSARKTEDQNKLFLLCKEGVKKSAIEEFHDYVQSVNRFTVGAVILSEPVLSVIRRELRKMTPGLKVSVEEIEEILKLETLKREIVDGDNAQDAAKRVKKLHRKKKVA